MKLAADLILESHKPQGQLVAKRVFYVVSKNIGKIILFSLYHKECQEKVLSANSIFCTKVLFTNSNLSNFPLELRNVLSANSISHAKVLSANSTGYFVYHVTMSDRPNNYICSPCYYVQSSKKYICLLCLSVSCTTTIKAARDLAAFIVVVRGFEPRQTEPKPVVLPLHHTTIINAKVSLFPRQTK